MSRERGRARPEHDAIAAKSLEARTALANYTGNTPWVDANKDNPEALDAAERLVKGGLRLAAATHTNNAQSGAHRGPDTTDANRQTEQLLRAVAEYKLAALGWGGYLHQDENAPDAYESRFWLADARYRKVKIEVLLANLKKGPPPTAPGNRGGEAGSHRRARLERGRQVPGADGARASST